MVFGKLVILGKKLSKILSNTMQKKCMHSMPLVKQIETKENKQDYMNLKSF